MRDFVPTTPGGIAPALAMVVLLGLLEFVSIYQVRPPAAVPLSAPLDEFSAARAFQHLHVIAQKPHPTGSAENARVRTYIIDQLKTLGHTPIVQTTPATFTEKRWHGPIPAA